MIGIRPRERQASRRDATTIARGFNPGSATICLNSPVGTAEVSTGFSPRATLRTRSETCFPFSRPYGAMSVVAMYPGLKPRAGIVPSLRDCLWDATYEVTLSEAGLKLLYCNPLPIE